MEKSWETEKLGVDVVTCQNVVVVTCSTFSSFFGRPSVSLAALLFLIPIFGTINDALSVWLLGSACCTCASVAAAERSGCARAA